MAATFDSHYGWPIADNAGISKTDASIVTIVGFLTASIIFRMVMTVVMTALLTRCAFSIYQDYLAFLSLGPGGTPSTTMGYLKIKLLGLCALKNPYIPAPLTAQFRTRTGYLQSLPKRPNVRPIVQGIVPHRQVTQRASPAMFAKLTATVEEMTENYDGLAIGTSCFEKHGTGLFSVSPVMRTCKGEVCHAHPIDGSLHMTLHPADAKVVLEAGWGERHPLARGGWFERFVPRGFVLIYSPSSDADLQVISQIIKAAVWHVGGDVAAKKMAR